MVSIASISQQIWDMKYRLKAPAHGNMPGEPIDKTIEDTWRRVAAALAAPERDPAKWAERFYEALSDFKFLPAGRVIAGAGSARDVTLFNCFVMGAIPDDMGGIFAHLREAALTMQQGGGIGYDFSTLRPKGRLVKGVGADASGPLSFMDVWDAMCRTIMSAGYRRGAMMATLRCDHPDIEAFVEAKREPGRLRNFNLSVLVTDAFMRAVEEDASWELTFNGSVHKSLPARELWDKIMRATYAYAEPGVIFIDRINQRNPLYYCEEIHSTNPCGEQPLPPYGACLLGSLNLARFVEEPFTPKARLDTARLAAVVPDVVRMMDNVIDISRFPLPEQKAEALQKRRIGLGITGLADALILCGLRYGSKDAVAATEAWLGLIEREAYLASAALAAEKGPFPLFDKDKYLAGETIAALDDEVKAEIAKHGIRNSLLTSVAPTGTISLFADNVSSGIEPVFSFRYTRTVLMPDGARRQEEVSDHAYRLFRRMQGETAPLTAAFVDAQSLAPEDHLVMQAAVQKYVDSSISKTINLPADIAVRRFQGHLRPRLCDGLQGLHDLPAERGDRCGARGAPRAARRPAGASRITVARAERGGEARRPLRGRRRRLYVAAAVAARGAARTDLQDQLARERARHVHHGQRRGAGRAPPAVRDLHQLEEHGALCLDRRADPDDQRGVPPRRRRVVCRRGDEGGVRPARRRVDGGKVRALAAGGDRRRHRAPHDRYRVSALARPQPARPYLAQVGNLTLASLRRLDGPAPQTMPEMRPGRADPQRRLRSVHQLRLLEVRVSASRR